MRARSRMMARVVDEEEKALARRSDDLPDPYERQYMKGEGLVLYRDKMVAGRTFNLVMGAIVALSTIQAALTGTWLGLLTLLPILAIGWVLFGVLRVVVSEGNVTIRYGLLGPTIPVHAIESAQAIEYKWAVFGGWGIRRGPEGWMYNMIGDGGRAVKIVWTDAKGKRRVTYVGTRTADDLAAAIGKARRALPRASEPPALGAADNDEE
jgi:hypothetical protein